MELSQSSAIRLTNHVHDRSPNSGAVVGNRFEPKSVSSLIFSELSVHGLIFFGTPHARHSRKQTPVPTKCIVLYFLGYFQDNIACHFTASMISGLATTYASMPVDIAKTR